MKKTITVKDKMIHVRVCSELLEKVSKKLKMKTSELVNYLLKKEVEK